MKFALIFALAALTSTAALAEDTKIRHRDGSGTVVRTDSQGTRTRNTGGGGTTYGDRRHNDAVRENMRAGSRIVK